MRPAFELPADVVARLNASTKGLGDSLNRKLRDIGIHIEGDSGHRGQVEYKDHLNMEGNKVTGAANPTGPTDGVTFAMLKQWSTCARLTSILSECFEVDDIIESDVDVIGSFTLPYFFGFVQMNPCATATTVGLASADDVGVWQFLLPAQVTVTSLTYEITAAIAAQNLSIGLYSEGGNLVIDTGPQSSAATGVFNVPITPVALDAGFYHLAYTASGLPGLRASSYSAQVFNLFNETTTRVGKTGTSTGAVLPSTRGSITANTQNPPLVLFESS